MPNLKTNTPSNNCKTLLLVDDDRLVLVTLAQGLSVKGYKILKAESAEDAEVILAGGERPDLAIIDFSMPGKSGLELAKRLQTFDQIPFIFLSAYSDSNSVEQATEYGALSYQVKPIDPEQLAPVIEAALARSLELNSLKSSERALQTALDKEKEISIAIGITMMQYRLGRKAAFELLRDAARSRRSKLADIASDVIKAAETLNFDLPKNT
jgi:response regulator NasT